MRIKHVHQKDKTGCGIAAVAMFANRTYNQVKEIALKKGIVNEDHFGTTYADIKKLIKAFKLKYEHQKEFKKWQDIPHNSIVATGFKQNGCWHWVVFVRKKNMTYIYDPDTKENIKLTDFRGRGLGKYIAVYAEN